MRLTIAVTAFALSFASCCMAQTKPLALSVLPNGHVRFADGPELDISQLRAKVEILMRENPRPEIRILPSKDASYSAVAEVLQTFQEVGYGPLFGFVGTSN